MEREEGQEREDTRFSYTVEEACKNTGLARTRMYAAIGDGSLHTFKVGRRRMVSSRALHQFVDMLERAGSAQAVNE